MIVVTGANGQLGRGVVDRLRRRVPADRIVASVRDVAQAEPIATWGVAVRAGDFASPDQMAAAFAGADQVLLISVDQFGEPARRLHRAAIRAAHDAAVGRLLYTSHVGARPGSAFADHAAAEAVLAETGARFTALRHGFYAESALFLVGRGVEQGEICAPADGPVSWTARADLAEADAVLLADEGRLDGITPPLTAPEAFTMADLAAIASELTQRTIKRTIVPDAIWRDGKIAEGVPAPVADALLAMFQSARRGELAATDPTLERLLGRRPQTLRDILPSLLGAG